MEIEEVGLVLEPRINPFFFDFFTSNIQLYMNMERKEIQIFPYLDHNDRYFSNMLEEFSVPCELIDYSSEEALINVFATFIETSYYVYLELRDWNILYGFDKEKQVFKRMTINGELKFSEISFCDFLSQYHCKKQIKNSITLYKYKSWKYPNDFNISMIIANLNAYLEGNSSFAITTRKQILYFTDKPFVYGINVYKEIAEDQNCMDYFLKDISLSAKIHEHYQIVLNMLEFIRHHKVISEEEYIEHKAGFKVLARLSGSIKNLVFKNAMEQIENISEKLSVLLHELKEQDELETDKLISSLEKEERK